MNLSDHLQNLDKLQNLNKAMGVIDSDLDKFDSIIEMQDYQEILKSISLIADKYSRDEFVVKQKIIEDIKKQVLEGLELSNLLKIIAVTIFLLMMFLVCMIVRKINHGVKTHIF